MQTVAQLVERKCVFSGIGTNSTPFHSADCRTNQQIWHSCFHLVPNADIVLNSGTLFSFIRRNRFRLRELASGIADSRHIHQLAKCFHGYEYFDLHFKEDERRRLKIALMLGSYMAEYCTDYYENFARLLSELSNDEWSFALQYCPFHRVEIALNNLDFIEASMEDSFLGLSTSLAGMEAASAGRITRPESYIIESSKAISSLLSFTTLYATYVDTCRRVRNLTGLDGHSSYNRAVRRLISRSYGQNQFIKDFRNFQLHYRIVRPDIVTTTGETVTSKLCLTTNALLYSGYKWKPESRTFLELDSQIDVIETVSAVLHDIRRQTKFHRNLVRHRLRRERIAYDTYIRERDRHKHLQAAVIDLGAAFKRPSSLMERLLDSAFVDQILDSALSETEMFDVLFKMANRHLNLPAKVKKELEGEIRHSIAQRPIYPSAGAYLQGRKHD